MQVEMTEHLGYEKHDPAGNNSGNSRNGATTKTLKGDFGEVPLETPRDRNGSYSPKIIGQGQTRFSGFDDKIVSRYARGMSTREIQGHLQEIYQVEVSPTLISNVAEEVMEEVKNWQNRPLDAVYPIVYLDALVVKIREAGHVRNKAIYVAIGVNMEGNQEVLGLWAGPHGNGAEGAKFWPQVLTELKNRGVADMFIVCIDGLKGFPEAIQTVFPKAQVQLCLAHQVRGSQGGGRGSEADLSSRHGGRGRAEARGVRREMGRIVSDHPPDVAPELGTLDAVFRLSGGHSQGDLYDQRGGKPEHELAESDQNQGLVSEPGGGFQAAVSGLGTHRQKVDHADPQLEGGAAALRDPARGPRPERPNLKNRNRNISRMGAPPPSP